MICTGWLFDGAKRLQAHRENLKKPRTFKRQKPLETANFMAWSVGCHDLYGVNGGAKGRECTYLYGECHDLYGLKRCIFDHVIFCTG